MGLEIRGLLSKSDHYEYTIKYSGAWGLKELLLCMKEVSKKSVNYKLQYDMDDQEFYLFDNRDPENKRTKRFNLTNSQKLRTILIIDGGGLKKQNIEKFIRAIENPQILDAVKKTKRQISQLDLQSDH